VGRVVVTSDDAEMVGEAKARGYKTLIDSGWVRVFQRPTSPHYFFSSDYLVMTAHQALRAIGELPPGRTLVLESPPGIPSVPNRVEDPVVNVKGFWHNGCRLEVDAPRPGLVYAADSFANGWRARVNGRPTPIEPANYAFRAIALPAGRSEIVMTYRPPGLLLGGTLSALSALLIFALAGRDLLLQFAARPASAPDP
jgi:hypothetical protein